MRKLLFSILSLITVGGCVDSTPKTALEQKGDTTLTFLTYGLPDMEQQRAMRTVAKWYGFKYKAVGGCVVSDELMDSVRRENAEVDKVMAQRFGAGWKDEFDKKMLSMREAQNQVEQLVNQQKSIIILKAQLEARDISSSLRIDPSDRKEIFMVRVLSWDRRNYDAPPLLHYLLHVNMKTNLVTVLSDTIKPLTEN